MEFDGVLQSRIPLAATGSRPLAAQINDPLARTKALEEEIAEDPELAMKLPTT
jgi:hypothetical protein